MTRTYQVEYFNRTTETDVVKFYGSNRSAAHTFARRMSDKHDGGSYVVSMENDDSVGHVIYMFGVATDRDGDTK